MSKILSLSFFACPTDATHCWEGAVTIASLYTFFLLTGSAPFGHNTNAGHVWGYLRHTPSAISGLSWPFLLRWPVETATRRHEFYFRNPRCVGTQLWAVERSWLLSRNTHPPYPGRERLTTNARARLSTEVCLAAVLLFSCRTCLFSNPLRKH